MMKWNFADADKFLVPLQLTNYGDDESLLLGHKSIDEKMRYIAKFAPTLVKCYVIDMIQNCVEL